MHTLTTIIVTAFATTWLVFPFAWALARRTVAPRWPQRVCGRLYDGGGIGRAGVTVEEMDQLHAGGTGR